MVAQAIYATRYDRINLTNPCLLRNGVGLIDGKLLTVSGWIEPDLIFGGSRVVLAPWGSLLYFRADDALTLEIKDANSLFLRKCIGSTPLTQGSWNHFIVSVDLSDLAKQHFWVNGIEQTGWDGAYTDLTTDIDLIGWFAFPGNANSFDGCATEWWLDDVYFDLDVLANREKFYVSTGPAAADLGADGEIPNGVQPAVYLRGEYPNHNVNSGTGGDFNPNPDLADMRVCAANPPARDPGIDPPSDLVTGEFTYIEANGIMSASVGNPGSVGVFSGEVQVLDAHPYIRPVSPDGEIETLIYNQDFNDCIIPELNSSTGVNTLWCGNYANGSLSGTINQIESAPGERYLTFAQTLIQAPTSGRTNIWVKVPGWPGAPTYTNRRLKYRTHYRWKFRVRLQPDYDLSGGTWDTIWRLYWGNLDGALNAAGGGNPTITLDCSAADGQYNATVRGSPIFGGPLVQGDFATAPTGYEQEITGGNYKNDVGNWVNHQIDYFNSKGQQDGFCKITVGGQIICNVTDEYIGLWYKDLADGAEGFDVGINCNSGNYGLRSTLQYDLDDLQIFEVTQGGSQEQKPISFTRGQVILESADGSKKDTLLGQTVISSSGLIL